MTDPAPPVGTCTYRCTHADGIGYAPTSASASVPVSLRTTDLTLLVVLGTGSAKKLPHITAQLGGCPRTRL